MRRGGPVGGRVPGADVSGGTERVAVVPYRDVTANHARREGEGDCSLAFWRQVHEAFFTEELARAGMVFRQDLPVVCEEFVKVYSQPT